MTLGGVYYSYNELNLLSFSSSSLSVIVMGAMDDLENDPGW